MAGRLADAGRSSTVPLTFFQGLAVPLQCVGRTQAPVYRRIPKSCFVFSCLLLQSVPGSVGDSSCWSFTGLEREGFGFFRIFFPFPLSTDFVGVLSHSWNDCSGFLSEGWRGAVQYYLKSGLSTANKVMESKLFIL